MLKALSATGQKYLFDEFGATNFLALMEGVTHFGPGGMQGRRNVKIFGGDKPRDAVTGDARSVIDPLFLCLWPQFSSDRPVNSIQIGEWQILLKVS